MKFVASTWEKYSTAQHSGLGYFRDQRVVFHRHGKHSDWLSLSRKGLHEPRSFVNSLVRSGSRHLVLLSFSACHSM
jgi:hypothetical protein